MYKEVGAMNNNIVNKEDTNFKKKTDEELRKKIGKNIHLARITANFTQEQLAEQIDVSTVFISQIENGSRKPSLETIYKISIALKIKIDTLINNDTADENIRDIEKLIELLSRCSPSERDFVTDISREVIIKLMEHKILN